MEKVAEEINFSQGKLNVESDAIARDSDSLFKIAGKISGTSSSKLTKLQKDVVMILQVNALKF